MEVADELARKTNIKCLYAATCFIGLSATWNVMGSKWNKSPNQLNWRRHGHVQSFAADTDQWLNESRLWSVACHSLRWFRRVQHRWRCVAYRHPYQHLCCAVMSRSWQTSGCLLAQSEGHQPPVDCHRPGRNKNCRSRHNSASRATWLPVYPCVCTYTTYWLTPDCCATCMAQNSLCCRMPPHVAFQPNKEWLYVIPNHTFPFLQYMRTHVTRIRPNSTISTYIIACQRRDCRLRRWCRNFL